MNVPIHLRINLETEKEKNAHNILDRVRKIFEFELRELTPYSMGGFVANISTNVNADDWPDVVLSVFCLAQSLAIEWYVRGSINDCIDLSTSKGFRVSGVAGVWIVCDRPK